MLNISLPDILTVLDKWKDWKLLQESPKRIDALEIEVKRLNKVIEELKSKPKGKDCPKCLESTFRLEREDIHPMMGDMGVKTQFYKCSSCGFSSERVGVPD